MAENSKIAWTTHTFNPWRGCQKVAAGCTFCYADAQSKRNPGVLGVWGPNGTRVIASESMWKKPLKWNREAQCNCGAAGMGERQCKWCEGGCQRPRVFCASIADVFEDWDGEVHDSQGRAHYTSDDGRDMQPNASFIGGTTDGYHYTTLNDVRTRLFRLIDATPNLDWLLLTKRPENIRRMLVPHCLEKVLGHVSQNEGDGYHVRRRENLWLGTSVAEQADADRNIPLLLKCRDLSPVLFVSAEPLIGPVGFRGLKCGHEFDNEGATFYDALRGASYWNDGDHGCFGPSLDWIIVGGESGHKARGCNVDWIRSLVMECKDIDTAVFVKQLGSNCVASFDDNHGSVTGWLHLSDPKGGDIEEFPEDLRVREIPNFKRSNPS